MEYAVLIEKYLRNSLTAEEKLLFNDLLKNNEEFKKEVALQTDIKKVVTYEDDANFRRLVSNLESEAKSTTQKRSYSKWLVAASLMVLFGLTLFMNTNQKASSEELFTSYFVPYRNVVHPIVRGEEQLDKKATAFIAYEKGNYKKAITLFTNLYDTTKEPYYLFYKANALLKLEKANEAIPLLLEHLKTKDTLTQKTNWYLALAYLKVEKDLEVKEFLNLIINEGSYKNKEAVELLKKLE